MGKGTCKTGCGSKFINDFPNNSATYEHFTNSDSHKNPVSQLYFRHWIGYTLGGTLIVNISVYVFLYTVFPLFFITQSDELFSFHDTDAIFISPIESAFQHRYCYIGRLWLFVILFCFLCNVYRDYRGKS